MLGILEEPAGESLRLRAVSNPSFVRFLLGGSSEIWGESGEGCEERRV